jgi:alpha-glucosidase (family GH31 glycosyl hydrolase)
MRFFTELLFIGILLFSSTVIGQNDSRKYLGFETEPSMIRVQTNDGHYEFSAYNATVLETSFFPLNDVEKKGSHAVVQKTIVGVLTVKDSENKLSISSAKMTVEITKSPFQIRYFRGDKLVLSEKRGYSKSVEGESIEFNLTKDEVIYGGGARALGMNRRGNRLSLYNKAHYGYENKSELMNYTLPIVFSSEKYLIHFDNAPIGSLDLDSKRNNTLVYETISGRKTYQVIVGEDWEEIIENPANIVIVEWAEKIKDIIPQNAYRINFKWLDEDRRKIIILKNKIKKK